MKRKINVHLLSLSTITMLATLILVVGVFYELFQKEVLDDLKTYTHVLAQSSAFDQNIKEYAANEKQLRITIIEPDGSIKYDSLTDIANIPNHGDRPEVKVALEEGTGESVRKSETSNKNTFYYAVRLNSGEVLRVAREADSIWSVFASVFPIIGGIVIILFIVCIGLAHMMTKSLVTPIEQLVKDLEHCEPISTYKELMPLIAMIRKQHDDILRSAQMRQEFTANVSHELKTPLTAISGYSELIENGMANDKGKQHDDILRSAQMRQEFTANVSHELKTPLTAISGYSELIENGMANDKDMRRFAREIHQNSKRLLMLINDIIQLAELDASEVEIPFDSMDLYEVAKSCINMIEINAQNHGVSLNIEGSHCEIIANKEMIEEVIFNLCDNAIRYNNRGGSVNVKVEADKGKAVLIVKDTGIGISKEHQERIFERFYRVDRSRSKSTGGTGLGLAIVKHVLTKHHADLVLQSEEGKGTEIKVVFN